MDTTSDSEDSPRGRHHNRGRKRRNPETDKQPESVQYHCDYCQKDISDTVRIRCAQCKDFDLCLYCFSVGVEIRGHKNDHPYKIMDYTNFPLFEEGWGADEELLLLEGVQLFGLGNWEDVAEQHVATKNAQACKQHYFNVYIDSETSPLPDTTHLLTTNLEEYHRRRQEKIMKDIAEGRRPGQSDSSDSSSSKSASSKASKSQGKKIKTKKHHNVSQPVANPDQAGYMPKRQEFETEWDNDIEFLIADLVFEDTDTQEETEMKHKMLDIYNRRLSERVERRRFVIENDLLDWAPPPSKKAKFEKAEKTGDEVEEKTMRYNWQKLVQITNRKNYEEFIRGVVAEQKYQRRILQLQEWRKQGILSVAEGELYEAEKKRREAALKKHAGSAGPAQVVEQSAHQRGARFLNRRRNLAWSLPVPSEKDPKLTRATKLPLDLTAAPSLEHLSAAERDLCGSLRVYPQQYLLMKEALIKEAYAHGSVPKTHLKKLLKLDAPRASRLHEFMERNGWFNRPPAPPAPATIK
eukprot:TRINITY_DN7247_c0_g1_i1.p1 TRINITY_DN7247_c0_g1~~TRINITY_DN7247_c0_g1_i1.p1  ORF type:complete len:529 (-),score=97.99 TRINITY_DN7247_c0_g1_i1:25-1590(-)